MRIASLEALGVPSQLLSVWENALSPELLPIQAEAVTRFSLFSGENLLVQAPTSAGKTFIGEMAASRCALSGRRVLYLAPTRALAEEKYARFQQLYGCLGLRVLISTRDRREGDQRFTRGDFDLAVAVPEKVRALWARSSGTFRGLGLVVVDELQLLADPQRGACLEVLLSEFRQTPDLQIIGLSACLGTSPKLADYLRAGWLESRERPVELRKGVLLGDDFTYREHNSGRVGRECLPDAAPLPGEPAEETIARLAASFAARDEPTLVFVRDRATAMRLAWLVARQRGAEGEPGECALRALEPTAVRDQLCRLMPSGVAFHSGELQFADRQAVEEAFRQGAVQVLCATPTLALGVNLPARNVIIDPHTWDTGTTGQGATLAPISAAEYENRAGRAGRLGLGGEGRAILFAETELARTALEARYLAGAFAPPEAPLLNLEPLNAVLALAALSAPLRQGDLATAYSRTFSAYARGDTALPAELAAAAHSCLERRLLRRLDGHGPLVTTALGKVAAAAGVSFSTFTWLLQQAEQAGRPPTDLEALLVVLLTAEAQAESPPGLPVSRATDYAAGLRQLAEDEAAAGSLLETLLTCPERDRPSRQRAARDALTLWQWLGPEQTHTLEQRFRASAARLEGLGEAAGWLLETLADLGAEVGWPLEDCTRLQRLAERLALGLAEDALALGRLGLPGLGRDHLRRLAKAGYTSRAALREAEPEALGAIVGEKLARQVREALRPRRRPQPTASAPLEPATAAAHRPPSGGAAVLVLDEDRPDEAVFHGQRVALRPAEFRLLRVLAENPGKCVRYATLYARMWDGDTLVEPGQLYSHRSRLSAKLRRAITGSEAEGVLVTVPKHGLRLNLLPEEVRIA